MDFISYLDPKGDHLTYMELSNAKFKTHSSMML